MKNRIISLILVISMLMTLTGCGDSKPAKTNEKLLIEGILDQENTSLESQGVKIAFDPVNLPEGANVQISTISGAPPLDEESGINLLAYDFTVDGVSEFPGVVEITIPLEINEGEIPGAAYFNEQTSTWEPVAFRYNPQSKSVLILTDHLSKYGVFSVSGEGSRKAKIQFLGLYGEGDDEDFLAAVEEFSIGGVPASKCVEIGSSAAGDALQLGGDFLGNMVQSAGYMAYGDDVLSSVGDRLGSIGLLVSVVQIGTNIYNGKINDALVGSMKTSYTYMMGKVVSKLSNSVLSAGMASVAIVDYAINKFGTAAIEGRADIYRDAYSIYYTKKEDGYKGSDYWYNTFYPMFSNPNMTQDQIKGEVDKIVTEHCNEFWTGTNKLGVDYYVSEARKRMAWTGGGAGLNQDLQNSLSQERRSILYNEILPGVFNQIALKINMENERKLRNEYKDLTDYLNTVVSFSVKDDKKTYANYIARFSPLNEEAEIDNWTGKFKDDGSISTTFTLYGHMYAGAPNKLDIFEPDADLEKDEPVRSIDFKVTPPTIEIVLGDELTGLKYEGGDKSKIIQLGLHAALRGADVIKVEQDGTFTAEVDYATASGGEGNNTFTSEVSGFVINGKIDPGTLSGTANFSGLFQFRRKEKSPLAAMEGETKEYITSYNYDDMVEGTINISGDGETAVFSAQMKSSRSGYTKLQYHSIDQAGTEFWGDNPTITDKSEELTSSGTYKMSLQR